MRDPTVNSELWPQKFVKDLTKKNANADDRFVVKQKPSTKPFESKRQRRSDPKPRLEVYSSGAYKKISETLFRSKKGLFVPDGDEFRKTLKVLFGD